MSFFSEKLAEAQRKYANLKSELETSKQLDSQNTGLRRRKSTVNFQLLKKDKEHKVMVSHTRKIHDLKLAFSEFYLSLILLQNYQTLNFTGFRKILKKHDKVSSKYSVVNVIVF